MKNATCLWAVILLSSIAAFAIDPPVKLWEKQYYSEYDVANFVDLELTGDGNLFITCKVFNAPPSTEDNYVAILVDTDGNILWEVSHPFAGAYGNDGTVLSDGSFAITGTAVLDS
jgi:hypothetical protein